MLVREIILNFAPFIQRAFGFSSQRQLGTSGKPRENATRSRPGFCLLLWNVRNVLRSGAEKTADMLPRSRLCGMWKVRITLCQ